MEIAILDDDGVIIGVQQCSEDDFKTDSVRKTVQLDDSHDMHLRLRAYKYDFNRNCFLPLST